MNSSKPPALAAWLLEHAHFNTTDGVVAGDLLEEFNRRRSATWYWRQVLLAIAVGWTSEASRHWVLAIRATVITWAVNYGAILMAPTLLSRYRLLGLALHPALASFAFSFLGGVASGALVAVMHRENRNTVLLTSAATLLGWAVIAIMFLKKGALQHSLPHIATVAIVYYLVAVTGFAIGGFLINITPRPDTPAGEHASALS
jgi:hypothetical protein